MPYLWENEGFELNGTNAVEESGDKEDMTLLFAILL